MLYYLLKQPIRLGFKIFFRKVYIIGEKRLPKDAPIIYASNHPTAFLDPIFPAAFTKRPFYFALRGDTFSSKLSKFLLAEVHCLPIFRFKDGFEALRKNAETFNTINTLLAEGKHDFMIMAEGRHNYRKKLSPIQKGTANIAFGAWKKEKLDNLVIVPLGFHYSDSDEFRSWASAKFGEPIPVSDFIDAYEQDSRKAIDELTDKIQTNLRKVVVHIEHDDDEPGVNRLFDIARNNRPIPVFPLKSRDGSMMKREIRIADQINTMEEDDKADLFELLNGYDFSLKEQGLQDVGLAQPYRFNFFNTVWLIFGFIPFLIGYGLNWPVFRFIKNRADRMAKKIEFRSSLRLGFGILLVPVWWLILFVIALIAGAGWWSFLIILLPFLGYFSLVFTALFKKWNAARKVRFADKTVVRNLALMRADLLGRIE